jgi:hypothetical protein
MGSSTSTNKYIVVPSIDDDIKVGYSTYYIASFQDNVYHTNIDHCNADIPVNIQDTDVSNYKVCKCNKKQDSIVLYKTSLYSNIYHHENGHCGASFPFTITKEEYKEFQIDITKGIICSWCLINEDSTKQHLSTGLRHLLYKNSYNSIVYHRVKGHYNADKPYFLTKDELKNSKICSRCTNVNKI